MFYFENIGCPRLNRYDQQPVVALYPATASPQPECDYSPMICAHFQSGDKVDIPISGLKGVDGAISSSLHKTRSGKIFIMLDSMSRLPIRWAEGRHNYTKRDLSEMEIGQTNEFMPLFGNKKPVWTRVIRLV